MAKLICSVFVLALLFAATAAKNSSPAPAVDCSSVILEMADCLSYVTADGTASRPEGNCCSGLKSVLKTNAECLCEAFRNSAQLGVTLNMTKAMALPSACHVAAPSVSNCGTMSNGGAPGQSPMLAPTSSVAGAPTAGISANDISPAPAPSVTGVGGASSSAVTISVELFGLATLAAVSLVLF